MQMRVRMSVQSRVQVRERIVYRVRKFDDTLPVGDIDRLFMRCPGSRGQVVTFGGAGAAGEREYVTLFRT